MTFVCVSKIGFRIEQPMHHTTLIEQKCKRMYSFSNDRVAIDRSQHQSHANLLGLSPAFLFVLQCSVNQFQRTGIGIRTARDGEQAFAPAPDGFARDGDPGLGFAADVGDLCSS
jgi:hypothetical protein